MDKISVVQYILLLIGIFVFFGMFVLLVRTHRTVNTEPIQTSSNNDEVSENSQERDVSEYFNNNSASFDDDFDQADPFSKYCSGNEGSVNSFTVCAGN